MNKPISMTASEREWDAVVVGAGPAGTSAAYHLARSGRRVLVLDRRTFPREKSCGDALTPYAVGLLRRMDALRRLEHVQVIHSVKVFMRDRGHREFPYGEDTGNGAYGLVCRRVELDDALLRHATEAGAVVLTGWTVTRPIEEHGRFIGVEARDSAGVRCRFRGKVVLAADGASSRLARWIHNDAQTPRALGIALRAYYDHVEGLTDTLEIYLPLLDASDSYLLPSYGWVFPTGAGSANVGVGLFHRPPGMKVTALLERFIDGLFRADPRFTRAIRSAPPAGAPLRFDFNPERCTAPGLLLLGDAAGLVSPFTGEGISFALESGRLAAEVIDRGLRVSPEDPPIESDYRTLLDHRFAGHFEAGRASARRYLLIWHVLESTFGSERPVFDLLRRLVLLPEAEGGGIFADAFDDLSPMLPRGLVRVADDLQRSSAILIDVVRSEWPFLMRLIAGSRDPAAVTWRPALFASLAAQFGHVDRDRLGQLSAGLELAYVSFFAEGGVDDPEGSGLDGEGANWGDKFALLLSDFLLAQSFEILGGLGAGMTAQLAGELQAVCEARAMEHRLVRDGLQSESNHLSVLEKRVGPLLALPCRLGADLAGARDFSEPVSEYGRNLAVAYTLMEDLRFLLEGRGAASPLRTDIRAGVLPLAVLRALDVGVVSRALLADGPIGPDQLAMLRPMLSESGVPRHVRAVARMYARRALAALHTCPHAPVRTALVRLARYAVTRHVPAGSKLEDLIRDTNPERL